MRLSLRAVVVAFACLAMLAAPARADDELTVSWDGEDWSSSLDRSLFDPETRWVPGDTRTTQFYVRNNASDRGDLTVTVESLDPDHLLRSDDIRLEARLGTRKWIALERTGEAFRLATVGLLAAGEERIRVRASFDPAATNSSQHSQLRLTFRVTLSEARAAGEDGPDSHNGAPLPNAGGLLPAWPLAGAAIAVGIGLALIRRGREERHGQAR